jgi:hypothetical protein
MFYSFVREEGTVPDRCGRPVCFNPDPTIATQCGNHCVQYDKWYCGLALFSRLGTARLSGITAG